MRVNITAYFWQVELHSSWKSESLDEMSKTSSEKKQKDEWLKR